jgi:hypothetical protein
MGIRSGFGSRSVLCSKVGGAFESRLQYQSFVFCKEYGDASVDFADCKGDEHYDSSPGSSCEGVRDLCAV